MVDPGCSSGGFDDVQDLHDKRVVMARTLLNALKTIPQKGAVWRVQRFRRAGTGRQMRAGKIEDNLLRVKPACQKAVCSPERKVTDAGYKSEADE